MQKQKQTGFSLMEMTIALSLVALMAGAVVSMYDTNRSRAEILKNKLDDINAGLLRMKADTSCFPRRMDGLVTPAQAADTFCGTVDVSAWKGPYLPAGTMFTNTGRIKLETISPSLEVYLDRVVLNAGTPSESAVWKLKTEGLTSDIRVHLMDKCGRETAGSSKGSRCDVITGSATEAEYTLDQPLMNLSNAVNINVQMQQPGTPPTPIYTYAAVPVVTPVQTVIPLSIQQQITQLNAAIATKDAEILKTTTELSSLQDPQAIAGKTALLAQQQAELAELNRQLSVLQNTPSLAPAGTLLGKNSTTGSETRKLLWGDDPVVVAPAKPVGIGMFFDVSFYAGSTSTEIGVVCGSEVKKDGKLLGVEIDTDAGQQKISTQAPTTIECPIQYCNTTGTCDIVYENVSFTAVCGSGKGATCAVTYDIEADCIDYAGVTSSYCQATNSAPPGGTPGDISIVTIKAPES